MSRAFAVFPGLDAIFVATHWERWLSRTEVTGALGEASGALARRTGEAEDLGAFLGRHRRPHLADFDRTLVALTAIQLGIARAVLARRGFDGFVSCSHGDFARLVAAGALSLDDAVDLLWYFADLRRRCPEGTTALVSPDIGDFTGAQLDWLDASDVTTSRWSPRHATVSGLAETVAAMRRPARARQLKVRPLLPYPVHSPVMRPVVDELLRSAGRWTVRQPAVPVYSSVGLRFLDTPSEIIADAVQGALSPVRWMDAILALVHEHGVTDYVNIGPSNMLISWVFETGALSGVSVRDAWDLAAEGAATAPART